MRGVPRERAAISAAPSAAEGEPELLRPARDDPLELGRRVERKPERDAEAVAQRGRQEPRAGRRADQREGRKVDAHAPRGRALADDQVELEVLHRRVEDFLDRRRQAMDLVDEEHVARLEVGEHGGKIARALHDRPRSRAKADAELAGDDLRERRLAEPGRPMQQHMVERLGPRAGRVDKDAEIVAQGALADELGERLRPEAALGGVLLARPRAHRALLARSKLAHRASSFRPSRTSASSAAPVGSRAAARPTAASASARR